MDHDLQTSEPASPEEVPQKVSRRALLRDLLAQGAALTAVAVAVSASLLPRPWLQTRVDPLTPAQWREVEALQALILPSEPSAPGAAELGATVYLRLALADPRLDPDDLESLTELLKNVADHVQRAGGTSFAALDVDKQTTVLKELLTDPDAAERFGVAVVFTLEAALSDPVYGGNRHGAGWRWLGLVPAWPQPPEPWFKGAV